MGSACGVSWDGTSGGKLDKSAIPDDDFESHYLNAGDTKSDSSFPVVDGEGNLRAGNVNSAWDLRNNGDGVSEECLRKLDRAFDDNVLPESAYDNSERVSSDELDFDGELGMNLGFSAVPRERLGDSFNEYGVRENEDGSVDVRFQAMEPGTRRGLDITPDFLANVTQHDYGRIPLQLDHSDAQLANAGYVKPGDIEFDGEFLQVQAHIPDTGSSVRDDIIADFTHEPPQITDISVSFDSDSVEFRKPEKRGDNPTLVDAEIREFSLTPFPAGYDNGGITAAFSEAAEDVPREEMDFNDPESQLSKSAHSLLRKKYE